MEIIEKGNGIIIHGIKDFYPEHIFDCGQAFRWELDGSAYVGIVADRIIRVEYLDECLYIENTDISTFNAHWKHYFDLERDYGKIKAQLSADPILKVAIQQGWGIRILNQDPWETLISFIISANNGITRIKGIIQNLSSAFGRAITYNNRIYYTFPEAGKLAEAELGLLSKCGCGYRAAYIKNTSQMIRDGRVDLKAISALDYRDAHKALLKLSGVGPKVADCILLFSMEKGQAFPVDVWVQRVMSELYFHSAAKPKQIKEFAIERFGRLAGIAQQYLFYYARKNGMGRR